MWKLEELSACCRLAGSSTSSVAMAIADVFRKIAIRVGYKFTKMLKIFDKIDEIKN